MGGTATQHWRQRSLYCYSFECIWHTRPSHRPVESFALTYISQCRIPICKPQPNWTSKQSLLSPMISILTQSLLTCTAMSVIKSKVGYSPLLGRLLSNGKESCQLTTPAKLEGLLMGMDTQGYQRTIIRRANFLRSASTTAPRPCVFSKTIHREHPTRKIHFRRSHPSSQMGVPRGFIPQHLASFPTPTQTTPVPTRLLWPTAMGISPQYCPPSKHWSTAKPPSPPPLYQAVQSPHEPAPPIPAKAIWDRSRMNATFEEGSERRRLQYRH
jgi:hypothetical protein